jgi:hypothetical protein
MWHWPVPEENLVVEKGEGTLRSYEFGSKNTTHQVSIPSVFTGERGLIFL